MRIIYVLMILIGLVAMYAILNAGNPDSLLRPWVPNPAHDVYVAAITSFIIFILGFFVFFNRDREGFQNLVRLNAERIRTLRRNGQGDEEIAESILSAMGSSGGRRHNLAKRKLVIYLSEFE
jgi:hypothetical protein